MLCFQSLLSVTSFEGQYTLARCEVPCRGPTIDLHVIEQHTPNITRDLLRHIIIVRGHLLPGNDTNYICTVQHSPSTKANRERPGSDEHREGRRQGNMLEEVLHGG